MMNINNIEDKYNALTMKGKGVNDKIKLLFKRLKQSPFRSGFKLRDIEIHQIKNKPIKIIILEGNRFIRERLAPFKPKNDGAQTPMKGHPVFIAQHATGTCCRQCLLKWHNITDQRALVEDEIDYILAVIEAWIRQKMLEENLEYSPIQQTLF